MSRIPLYFSHSYRRADREINAYFWRAFHDAGFSFTVDPETTSMYTTALELMMARSVGFAAVVTFREEAEYYQCSPFIMYEYGLAVQAHQPRIVVRTSGSRRILAMTARSKWCSTPQSWIGAPTNWKRSSLAFKRGLPAVLRVTAIGGAALAS